MARHCDTKVGAMAHFDKAVDKDGTIIRASVARVL